MQQPLTDRFDVGQVTIDKFPDNVLLEIFDSYRSGSIALNTLNLWDWQELARVCRRWRSVICASPQRLELHVIYQAGTTMRTLLDIWPLFPIAVCYPRFRYHGSAVSYVEGHEEELENVIAAPETRDRIAHIDLIPWNGLPLRRFVAVMLQQFVALTYLHLHSAEKPTLVLPEVFLGGSASRLRSFDLYGIAFPSLPKFIFSSNLVYLSLKKIPTSGYISPEAMAAFLAPLSNLKTFSIGFSSPRPRPSHSITPPLARVVLPALTFLSSQGVSEYFEDLIFRIDTPALDFVDIDFFMDLDFHIPQLNQLISEMISRVEKPNRAVLFFRETMIQIQIQIQSTGRAILSFAIHCDRLDYQVSSMTQVCRELSPYLSFVERLDMMPSSGTSLALQDDMDSTQWLELFHPFIAVQSLRVTKKLVPLVAPALQGLTGDGAKEVLPALSNLHLEGFEPSGSLREAIPPFITARQLSDHPVAIEFGEKQPSSQVPTTNSEDKGISEGDEGNDEARQ